MDPASASQIISSVGFPIAAAIGLFWYMVTENRETRKVVENNTQVLLRILEHVTKEDTKNVQQIEVHG